MNGILYILLSAIRYPISVIMFVVAGSIALLNGLLCGDFDHDKGLIGWVNVHMVMALDFVNKWIIRRHESLRPVGWTFKRAVTNYRKMLRWWSDRYASDYEYRQAVKGNINCSKSKWEREFWTAVKTRGDKLHDQRQAESIASNTP